MLRELWDGYVDHTPMIRELRHDGFYSRKRAMLVICNCVVIDKNFEKSDQRIKESVWQASRWACGRGHGNLIDMHTWFGSDLSHVMHEPDSVNRPAVDGLLNYLARGLLAGPEFRPQGPPRNAAVIAEMVREVFGYPWKKYPTPVWTCKCHQGLLLNRSDTHTASARGFGVRCAGCGAWPLAPWMNNDIQGIIEHVEWDDAWGEVGVLADALEDARCHLDEVVGHLRNGSRHFPGCWAVRLLKGHSETY